MTPIYVAGHTAGGLGGWAPRASACPAKLCTQLAGWLALGDPGRSTRWPGEPGQVELWALSPLVATREQGWKLRGLRVGAGVLLGPCDFSQAGVWGGVSPGVFARLPWAQAADVHGVMAGGWRCVQSSVLPLGVHVPPKGSELGQSWGIVENMGVLRFSVCF